MSTIRNAHHPYYATLGCYFSNECHHTAASWDEFMGNMGESDMDMNLLYRWDWQDQELDLFFILQRKAIPLSYTVMVDSTDEPAIREWLDARWRHLRKVWTPLSGDDV